MTAYHARRRRNRGAWLDALLQDQAEKAGADLEDLQEFISTTSQVTNALVALDNPAPARGYALILPIFKVAAGLKLKNTSVVRLHVLEGEEDAAYRALFSQVYVQTRNLRMGENLPFDMRIVVDSTTITDEAREKVEKFGKDYGMYMGASVREELSGTSPALAEEQSEQESESEANSDPGPGPDATSTVAEDEQTLAQNGAETEIVNEDGEATASAAEEAAHGDLEDHREFFEERGVELSEIAEEETEQVEESAEAPDYVAMNKSELVAAAKRLGVTHSGTAPELRQRLIAISEQTG